MPNTRKNSIVSRVKRLKFGNITVENLELGDILYFNYNTSRRQDSIINPCIIFGGVDVITGNVMGANIRNYYIDKILSTGNAFLQQYSGVYWQEKIDSETQETQFIKNIVSSSSSTAFKYENAQYYSRSNVIKTIKNTKQHVNTMQQYWRSYDPVKMYVAQDNLSTLTNNNILVNIEVARVIINIAPKTTTVQRGIL